MRRFSTNRGAAFDVPVEFQKDFDEYIDKYDKGLIKRGYKISVATSLPELANDNNF